MRRRYYIVFVGRREDGQLTKIPVPMHYAYMFLAAALVGLFTITGMAGSYSRMLLKTAHYNQVRSEREALRHDYQHMEQVAREKDIQAASLGSLASEVTALYGLRVSKLTRTASAAAGPAPAADTSGAFGPQEYARSIDAFYALRSSALDGHVRRALEPSFGNALEWGTSADAPSLWPVQGPVTSSFGEREDPFNGEGAFHKGIDIFAGIGQAVHAPADGTVLYAGPASGYGREIIIDHGRGIHTIYGHLSGFAVVAGQDVQRGDVIGYVGSAGRSTGPHLHYEVRIGDTPVNPHKYMRETLSEYASSVTANADAAGGSGSF